MKTTKITLSKATPPSGFTLLELLIVIAIISILSAIALPSYSNYIKQGKIPEATSKLSTLRVQAEQYYQDNRTYVGACAAGTVAPLPANDDFTYSCPTLTATTFGAKAVGQGSMAGFTFEIDQAGTRTTTALPTSWGTAPMTCWITRKGGTC
jgi:type IV pilus assembly protein PilE